MSDDWHATPHGLLRQGDTVVHQGTGEVGRVAGWRGTTHAVVVWADGTDSEVELAELRRQQRPRR